MPRDHAAYAFALALVSIVGIVTLSLAGQPVPPVLSDVAVGLSIGGAALSKGAK